MRDALRDPLHAAKRAAKIERRTALPTPGLPGRGGTVAVTAADRDGRMVSFLQSNFVGFGAWLAATDSRKDGAAVAW